ncbi:MAG: coproporphyrinogen III oxidase family protein [Chloroflexi bacterium]|nr:MAG: coproporphyrinogen III oxidase family protein [Chloroflexota bacterium]
MARRSRKDRGALRGRGAARSPRRHPPVSAISLYVHVPFCAARCPYCDFATAPATSRLRSRYLDALATEIGREGAALDRPSVRTLYVGGGTPSLLEPNEIASLAGALRDAFDLALEEATVEANPATLDRARLLAWRALGITRVSLGAQSLNTAGLRALGRTHQAEDTAAAVDAIRSLGLAVDAGAAQVDDEGMARLYRIAERTLQAAGYRHYEIANWARRGSECRHNLVYWRNGEWLGVGAGAHSHLAGARSRRPGALTAYLEMIDAHAPRIADPPADDETDTAMLALRLDEGLDLVEYAGRFGDPAVARRRAALAASVALGLVRLDHDVARLTPRGRLLASEVFVRLLPDDDVATRSRVLAAT